MDHSFRERKSSSIYSVQYDVHFDDSEDYSSSMQNTPIDQIHAECFGDWESDYNNFSHESNNAEFSRNNGFWKSIHSQEHENQENQMFHSLLENKEEIKSSEDECDYTEDILMHELDIGHPDAQNKTKDLKNHESLSEEHLQNDEQCELEESDSSDDNSYYEFEQKHQSCFQFIRSCSAQIDNTQNKLEETKNNWRFESCNGSQPYSGNLYSFNCSLLISFIY